MVQITEIRVKRGDLRTAERHAYEARALQPGEFLVEIDKFALTANNVTYGVAGDMIGYWKFYPVDETWGIIPVWGYATVVKSEHEDVQPGERFYGYYPFASHAILKAGAVKPSGFAETSDHRHGLPMVYNQYNNTKAEPDALRAMEDERSLFFPLFITSFLIADYFKDNDYFGAEQVLIGSVSSKTGFGAADCLKNDEASNVQVIGLTSPGNVDFVRNVNVCHDVVSYQQATAVLDKTLKTAYVDMSGNAALRRSLHEHFRDNLVEDCAVGITHWESAGERDTDLPGAEPKMFFAPSQIEKREKDWGPGVVFARAMEASVAMAERAKGSINIEQITDADEAAALWTALVENKVSPKRGLMVSLK